MVRRIDRRTFLALGAGALAWACARGGEKQAGTSPEPAGDLTVLATAQQGLAAGDSRNAVAFLRGQTPWVPKEIRARLVPPSGEPFAVELSKQRISFGSGGEEDHDHGAEVTDIFVFTHEFTTPGIWTIETRADGLGGDASFEIAPESPSPLVGGRAIASQSPTTGNARGVDPICTRTPPCSMHEVTIAEALRASKPLVVTFATPRYCTSRTCGPVVDLVEAEAKRVGDAASFVHVEVWRNTDGVNKVGGEAPVFAEWKFDTEPWTYFVGADGVVKDRWLGALGARELGRAVDSLVG